MAPSGAPSPALRSRSDRRGVSAAPASSRPSSEKRLFGVLRQGRGGEVSVPDRRSCSARSCAAVTSSSSSVQCSSLRLSVTSPVQNSSLYSVRSSLDTRPRCLPVAISLVGTGACSGRRYRLPRLVRAALARLDRLRASPARGGWTCPNDELILTVTFVTVGLSVLAHGVTASTARAKGTPKSGSR